MKLRHQKRYRLIWIFLLLLILSQLWSLLALAQQGDEPELGPATPEAVETGPVTAGDRDALLRQAAQVAFAGQRSDGAQFEVGVVEILEDWGLVNFRVQPLDEAAPGETVLALARWQENGWNVALESSAEFDAWLPQIPEALLAPEARAYLGSAVSTAYHLPELALPFPVGQTWKYAQGPYGGPKREAVDFAPFTPYEPIDFDPPGNRERIVTAAADGVVIDRYDNRLILRHAGGWETGYDSLAQSSNILRVGQFVYLGDKVGLASDELEPRRDPFVRFWLRHYSVEQVIDGYVLSGWRLIQDNSYQSGHGFGALVFEEYLERVDCLTVYSYHLHPQACHITHAPPSLGLVRVYPDFIQINRGQTAVTAIEAINVTNVYSVSLLLTFDADVLSVADADPALEGIQIAPGDIFTGSSFNVTRNFVAEDEIFFDTFGSQTIGFIFFQATLLPPAAPFNGTGSLAEITWVGEKGGQTRLVFGDDLLEDIFDEDLDLYNPDGLILSTTLKEGEIKVIHLSPVLTVRGQIALQGYYGSGGAIITAAGQQHPVGSDGKFELETEAGSELLVSAPGYLRAQVSGSPEGPVDLGTITLVGGDVTGDDKIDILDLAKLSRHYGDSEDDINGDGTIDLLDLSLAASNYGQQGPVLIPLP